MSKIPQTVDVDLGVIVATSGIATLMKADTAFGDKLGHCLGRHKHGDWGVVDTEDAQANDRAVQDGGRLLSAYDVDGTRVWIITEADRSVTTFLLVDYDAEGKQVGDEDACWGYIGHDWAREARDEYLTIQTPQQETTE